MQKTFTYNTSRKYNGEQNLIISVNAISDEDDLGTYTADVTFVDNSRNISGFIKDMLFFGSDTPEAFARAVLSAYDRCNYETI